MSKNGIRSDCSDAVDATGRYIWREDGKKEGRCCGIDFEKAGQKWRAKNCSNDDAVCASAAISTFVPFAYDATIALAYGLDKLVNQNGLRSNQIEADLLLKTIKNATVEGVTGPVSFEKDNCNRLSKQFEWVVYNYHETEGGFSAVGQIANNIFTKECGPNPCASMVFSEGNSEIPTVRGR